MTDAPTAPSTTDDPGGTSPLPEPVPEPMPARTGDPSRRSRYGLAAFMVGAGALHFAIPEAYERIVPKWLGHERGAVRWSGVGEIGCGMLLLARPTRRAGAWLTVATLLAVYPANIQMAVEAGRPRDAMGWAAWLRLPLQLPMIRWAYRHTRPLGDEPVSPPAL